MATTTALGFDFLRPPGATPSAAHALLLIVGTVGGPLLAGAITAWLLAPIGSAYRRGGLAIVSAFVAFVAMFIGAPLHESFGRPALAALALLFALVGARFITRARTEARVA